MLPRIFSRFIRASFAIAFFIAVAPALHAQENRAALDAFMKQLREHDAAIEEFGKKNAGVRGGGLLVIRTAAERVKTIKTEGLPADLQAAFREYVERTQAVAAVFKEWPEKAEDVAAFLKRKTAENPNFITEGQKAGAPAMTALSEAIAKVAQVGRKYGLEGLAPMLQ